MSEIFVAISNWTAVLLLLILYITLLADIFPRLFLRTRYATEKNLGRGLKKYTYPTGRAVLYEPHPSVRKYLNKYLLFTKDGYKYLKCCFDSAVFEIKYKVVMLNNKNKVIDALSVTENMSHLKSTANIQLHQDTSYVAIIVENVNGAKNRVLCAYNRLWDLALYFLSVSATSIALMFAAASLIEEIVFSNFGQTVVNRVGSEAFFLFGIIIGVVSVLIFLMTAAGKGIRVVLNEKK